MFSLNKAIVLLILITGIMIAGPAETEKNSEDVLANIPIYNVQYYEQNIETPAPIWDTNRVWPGASANLTRKVAIGQYFKGAADDTIRVITVQSGGTRYLVVATDTTSTGFGKEKFRIDTSYAFASGVTAHAVAVGDVDGDGYADIVAATTVSPYRVIWFEWNGTIWAPQDSFGVNASVWDLTIGDANNDGNANEVLVPIYASTGSVIRAVWTGTAWDTTRITFSNPTYPRGVSIGNIRSDLTGNEIYVSGTSALGTAHWNGVSWDTSTIAIGLASTVYDLAVGDVDGNLAGNELAAVHGSSSYQISIWNWSGAAWSGRAWAFTSSTYSGPNDIGIGNFLQDSPGNEIIITAASTTLNPMAFWLAPNGSGWVSTLPKTVASQTQYGVAIGNVNRFRTLNDEFVLSGYGSLVECEQLAFANDLGTYWVSMRNPTAIINKPDTITVAIYNPGSAAQSGFSVGYRFQVNPTTGSVTYSGTLAPGALDSVKIPITLNALGMDTLYAYTILGGDGNPLNDTTRYHIEVWDDSTMAASGFNSTVFPPQGWTRTILVGSYNWSRYTAGTSPTCTPLEGVGMAGYPSYSATAGSMSRLRTHVFNIGPTARKVLLHFYMYGDPGYTTNPDSVIIEYSQDGINYVPVAAFHRYNAVAGWYVHDVEIGDFASNTDLYISFLARSGYGNNMFIDSVRIFTTQSTAVATDAGVWAIDPFPVPHFVGDSLDVTVTIRNYGLNTLTSTPVFYTLGGADTVSATWTGSLPLNGMADYTFTQKFVPAQSGEDTLYAGTRLPGDQNADNDTTHLPFVTCPFSNIPPYTKDFDEDWVNSTAPPFCGWSIIDGGTQSPPVVDNNDWHRYVVTTPARTVARIYFSPVETSDDWLISPRFDCTQMGNYTLSYWHYYNDYSAATLDSGRVLVSTDGGTNWQTVAIYSNADDSGYRYVDISSIVNGQSNVKVSFNYVANDEYWWYVDDFMLDFAPDTVGPAIAFVEQPENTYLGGPYTVRATMNDMLGVVVDSLYYIIDDAATAVAHTSVAGDTFTYEIPTQAAGTCIDYYVMGQDGLANTSYSEQPRFWVLSPMAPTDLTAEGQLDSTVLLGWLPPGEELSYNGPVAYYWWFYTGNMIATQFTPQHTPCKLEAAAITFYMVMDTVEFHVWADDGFGNPGTDLYVDTIIVSQLYPNPEVIDLSSQDIIVDGDFHVGLFWLGDSTPLPVTDNGANTTRSKYNVGSGWLPRGYDWVMSAVVSYVAPTPYSHRSPALVRTLAEQGNTGRVKVDDGIATRSRLTRGLVEPVDIVGPSLLERILGISNFELSRSEVQGGPYTSLGTTNQSTYIDNTVVTETQYYYVVQANYTAPDTVSYYSNEATVAIDFTPPAYANTTFDTLIAGPWVVSTELTDWTELLYDSLAYRANGGAFSYVTSDSVSGVVYYYTIPSYPSYTLLEFYLFSEDASIWHNAGRDPASGYYSFTVTAINEYSLKDAIPDRVFLGQNRPNPFAYHTQVEYGVPRNMQVNISVYNAAGQIVSTLVDAVKAPGFYRVNWQGTDSRGRQLAEGIYFVRMTTDDLTDVRKVIFIK
jgi:hypothetical protein